MPFCPCSRVEGVPGLFTSQKIGVSEASDFLHRPEVECFGAFLFKGFFSLARSRIGYHKGLRFQVQGSVGMSEFKM